MSIQAFRKALDELPISPEERAALTSDELFVLVLTRRLDGLTETELRKLKPADLQRLAWLGLSGEVLRAKTNMATGASPRALGGNVF